MVVVVPDAGAFETFEAGLDAGLLAEIEGALVGTEVDLALPKFAFGSKVQPTPALQAMGMVDAFSAGAADFSGIDGGHELFISAILHQAEVDVTEEGTTAAAATAVVVGVTSVPPPPIPVTVDRPFLFEIRDVETGAVLFFGRVVDPRG